MVTLLGPDKEFLMIQRRRATASRIDQNEWRTAKGYKYQCWSHFQTESHSRVPLPAANPAGLALVCQNRKYALFTVKAWRHILEFLTVLDDANENYLHARNLSGK